MAPKRGTTSTTSTSRATIPQCHLPLNAVFKVLEYVLPSAATRNRFDGVLLPEEGYLQVSERPGFGIEIDEAALRGERHVHWVRPVASRPDGSTGYI